MYYSSFGILSLTLLVILNSRILRNKKEKKLPTELICYRQFLHTMMFYLSTDILWGFLYELDNTIPVYIDTILYFFAMALTVLYWSRFVVVYLNNNKFFDRFFAYTGNIIFALVLVSLVVNHYNPILFYYDDNGTYIPMPVRYSFLGVQFLLFLGTVIYSFCVYFKSTDLRKRHNLMIAVAGIIMCAFIIIQIIFPLLPFYAIGCLLASSIIHIFILEDEEQAQYRILEDALNEAERANASKSIFLTNMSHKIRTPINAILGMNEIVLRDSNDEKILSCANNIQKAGTSLLGIISDILDFSKIEAGKLELYHEEYSVPDMIAALYNLVRFRAEEKGLELYFQIDPSLPLRLIGDELRIKQVITNLLTNAVKYTNKGSVTFQAELLRKERGCAVIKFVVNDSGIGIKEEDLDRLFTAFDRLDTKRTRTIEGTGLGLKITAHLLDLMGTKLNVESIYNVGSTFYFELDQEIVDDSPVGEAWMNAVSTTNHPDHWNELSITSPESRVLIVDDTLLNLEVICGLLNPLKMQIDTATSGASCIDMISTGIYDLVFLDYLMPLMDGIETLAKIKEDYPEIAERTPIISLTASAVAGERERMLAAGFTDYLTKPVIISDMLNMLMKYLPEEKIHFSNTDDDAATPMEAAADSPAKDAPSQDIPDVPSALLRVEGPNVNEGIEYCGTADLYVMALSMYAKGINEKALILEDSLAKEDIELFTITVHSVKSTSLAMGLADFSAKAKELELAGKQNDLAFIRERFPAFLKEYQALEAVLLQALG